jgi:hypothetical protein
VSAYDVLRRVLSDRPIAFHPELARAFGGINEALFFQQIAYWSDKGDDPEWIYKSQVELEAETCLSAYQQKQARDHLKRLGVLQDERRGVPARLYYRIDWPATFRFLETANLDSGEGSGVDPRFRETRNLDSEKPASKDAGNLESISESTQRALPESPFEISKGLSSLVDKYDDARQAILPFASDLARELNDQAPLTSTTTRLTNLYRASGLDLDTFLDLLIAARGITQERTGSIRSPRPDGPGPKPKMAYWFTVLEDLIGQAQAATGTADR